MHVSHQFSLHKNTFHTLHRDPEIRNLLNPKKWSILSRFSRHLMHSELCEFKVNSMQRKWIKTSLFPGFDTDIDESEIKLDIGRKIK